MHLVACSIIFPFVSVLYYTGGFRRLGLGEKDIPVTLTPCIGNATTRSHKCPTGVWARAGAGATAAGPKPTHLCPSARPPPPFLVRSFIDRVVRPSLVAAALKMQEELLQPELAMRASPTRARYEIPRWRDRRRTRWRRPVLFDPATSNWEL